MRDLHSDKELGANISEDGKQTAFRLFAPRALKVILYLYNNNEDTTPYEI
jgi:1,4-alpha-glucan branching enzyme